MRSWLILTSGLVLVSSAVLAADYEIPSAGTLSDAIYSANQNTDGDTYEIEISGTSSDSGTIRTSTSLKGDATATLTGSLQYRGSGINSEISNLTFGPAKGNAVTSGAPGEGQAQDLTINEVNFSQRTGNMYGSAIFTVGNTTVSQSSFNGNQADIGGAIYSPGNTKTLTILDSSFTTNKASSSGGAINSSGTLNIAKSVFDQNTAGAYYGGALHTSGKTLITETIFTGNKASEGGAVYAKGSAADLTITGSSFIGNHTSINNQGTSDSGGAIYSTGKLNISDTRFEDNYATGAGAIYIGRGSGDSFISDSEFNNNHAEISNGGSISHYSGTLNIAGGKFNGNESKNGNGGAIYTESTLIITDNSEFNNNTAAQSGGAITTSSGVKEINVSNASFNNNTAAAGNGGAINAANSAPLNINGASFSQNRADNGYGGAIYASAGSVLKNISVDGNSASLGGGIMNFGTMTIQGNSSFTNNTAVAGGAVFTLGTLNLDTTDGNILFSGNKASDAGEGGADIYLNTDGSVNVNITGDTNTLSMDGGFGGTGYINKTGANTLVFGENADNTLFTGSFTQTAGTTSVLADNFFAGTNTVSDGSVLHFARDASINNLNLKNGGRLDLRRPGSFSANTLTVTDLISDGSAVVGLQTDGTTSDLLKITGSASGDVTLDIDAVGTNPSKNKIEVVNIENAVSDADFKLAGGKLDIGAHEYDLVHAPDTNWYLETEGDLTHTAKSVEGLPALHLSIVNAGMNELRKRLGDLRNDNPSSPVGTWVRGYGKHLRVHEKTGARMDLLGMEGGVDVMTHILGGRTYFGVLGGYMTSDNIRVFQSPASDAKGHSKTPVAGLYATWIEDNSNWFIDLTARHFWVHTDMNNIISNDETNGYDIKRNFWAFTAETGRQFSLKAPELINRGSSLLAIEPKLELRYIEGASKNFTTDNGEHGSIDTTHSLVSRFNIQTSYLPYGAKSSWKLFAELGLYNEWIGKTKVKFADTKLTTSDLSGLGFEASLGFNADISDDAYVYGALTLEAGKAYTSYMANAGLRIKF